MTTVETFLKRVADREAVVGILGLGYVGLPLALAFAGKGFPVLGFDVDPAKIEALKQGERYLRHIPVDQVPALWEAGTFEATTDFAKSAQADALLICVPTPLTKNREPDMRFIEATARSIGPHLRTGQLIALESTTWPGTTDELVKAILEEESGLKAGEDFFLAYSPEREDPGNPDFATSTIPKLVGGMDDGSREVAVALYSAAIEKIHPVSNNRIAEMAKLYENVFRSVNIALVNELKMVCDKMDLDVWEVIEAAATKPFGFMPFWPGPGLGGHCIPIDPFYLTWKAREYEIPTRFIELAGEINTYMPTYVVERLQDALNEQGKALNGAKVLILGVAYKKDVDDMRESPALRIIELLRERKAEVSYHDPYVPKLPATREYRFDLSSQDLTDDTLDGLDAIVVVTDHSVVDYDAVARRVPLVLDTRNATSRGEGLRVRRA